MILRKMADAIAAQSWFTVVLEVLIVVVGIFIGLQVDDWNKTRQDRVRETEYLQRIEVELDEDIAAFEDGLAITGQRREYAQLILTSLDDPETVRREPTAYIRSLVMAGFTYFPIVSNHTFEEIKSAGELGIIEDVELRISITEYYQRVRQYGQWSYLRELNQTEYLKRQAGILTAEQFQAFWISSSGYGPDVSEQEALAAYQNMLSRPAFIEWLPITLAFLNEADEFQRGFKENAEKVRENIAANLGDDSTGHGE